MDRLRLAALVASSVLFFGCPDDDGGGDTTTVGMTSAPATGTTGGGPDTTGTGGGPGTTGMMETGGDSTTGGPVEGTSSDGGMLTNFLEDSGPMCRTNVQGEYNACAEKGTIACNYLGDSDANGFIGCLTSAEDKGASTCFINDCVEVCDCLPPPATGTAVVVCDAILADGGMGCALDCSGGETCPDGMECLGSICFWPAA